MEAQLAAYRAEKSRQKAALERQRQLHDGCNWVRRRFSALMHAGVGDTVDSGAVWNQQHSPTDNVAPSIPLLRPSDALDAPSADEYDPERYNTFSRLDVALLVVKLALWLTMFAISVHYEFGAAYFLITALPIIYFSTSTRRRVSGEPSAYSVFNEHCEPIQGTVTAEKLQREMMLGPAALFLK